MTGIDRPAEESRAYFEAIEETFIRLRGAPLLLSPTDWQVAREWFEAGVPLDLVQRVLEMVFERRKERGASGRIQSLRYCSEAVWEAWREIQELEASGTRRPVASVEAKPRLAALSESLPAELPDREGWVERVLSLTGSSDAIESALAELDAELLKVLEGELDSAAREELDSRVATALAGLRDRLPAAEIEAARERIRRGLLRQMSRLPLLSLFSPEALAVESGSNSDS